MLARKKQKTLPSTESDNSTEPNISVKGRGGQAKGAQTNPSSTKPHQQTNKAHQSNAREGTQNTPLKIPSPSSVQVLIPGEAPQGASNMTETEHPNPTQQADDATNVIQAKESPQRRSPETNRNQRRNETEGKARPPPKGPRSREGEATIWLLARSLLAPPFQQCCSCP
jgi:hypothetical protein